MDERAHKINLIVNRANSDIDSLSKEFKVGIQEALRPESEIEITEEDYRRFLISEIVLFGIKRYINSESFCRRFWYSDANRTTFIVSDDNLNIWLREDFDFVERLYDNIMDSIERNPWRFQFGKYLNDEYIQYDITNFFDTIEKH